MACGLHSARKSPLRSSGFYDFSPLRNAVSTSRAQDLGASGHTPLTVLVHWAARPGNRQPASHLHMKLSTCRSLNGDLHLHRPPAAGENTTTRTRTTTRGAQHPRTKPPNAKHTRFGLGLARACVREARFGLVGVRGRRGLWTLGELRGRLVVACLARSPRGPKSSKGARVLLGAGGRCDGFQRPPGGGSGRWLLCVLQSSMVCLNDSGDDCLRVIVCRFFRARWCTSTVGCRRRSRSPSRAWQCWPRGP